MLKQASLTIACLLTLALGPALAAERATLLLKSGERVSGDLVDMGGVGFTIRVNGQERRIATNDVAVIDFVGGAQGLPEGELNAIHDQQIIVLKSGSRVQGRLNDISGSQPLKITFTADGNRREFASSEIGRIYLARPNSAVATSGSSSGQADANNRRITVPANGGWVDTGILVREGDRVSFDVTGEVRLSAEANDTADANGSKSQRYDPRSPSPRTLAGALIGRVGSAQPFGIGQQDNVPMPANGRLLIAVNDGTPRDNSGEFTVVIRAPESQIQDRR